MRYWTVLTRTEHKNKPSLYQFSTFSGNTVTTNLNKYGYVMLLLKLPTLNFQYTIENSGSSIKDGLIGLYTTSINKIKAFYVITSIVNRIHQPRAVAIADRPVTLSWNCYQALTYTNEIIPSICSELHEVQASGRLPADNQLYHKSRTTDISRPVSAQRFIDIVQWTWRNTTRKYLTSIQKTYQQIKINVHHSYLMAIFHMNMS